MRMDYTLSEYSHDVSYVYSSISKSQHSGYWAHKFSVFHFNILLASLAIILHRQIFRDT